MVQTNEGLLVCHAPEAVPERSDVVVARIHIVPVEEQVVSVDTRNTATPVVPVRAGVVDRAHVVVAEAGEGEEEGGWGGGAVRLNFIATCAGSK